MVVKNSPQGLIATTRTKTTTTLEDLVDSCGWPLLLDATPRRLHRELSYHDPECVLFWLEDRQGLTSTAKLISWSRERGARPFRVAVAFQMDGDVESVFRTAGAHGFLPVAGQSVAFVADAVWPLLQKSARLGKTSLANAASSVPTGNGVTSIEFQSDLVRPP